MRSLYTERAGESEQASDETPRPAPGASLALIRELEAVMGNIIKGKPEAIRLALVALLAGGHLLIEDVPGTGKTTLAHALARGVSGTFQRIQFTADLLPSDVTGLSFYNEQSGAFEFKPGPVFANILLADEINRATPKTQSALLEAMAEGQVTVEGTTYPLPAPFVVLATQNPIEHQGTFPLPESQLDRFMLRLTIGYPSMEAEREILRSHAHGEPLAEMVPVIGGETVAALQQSVMNVSVADRLIDYLLAIINATRSSDMIDLGVSPRGTLALHRAAQALAFIEGRAYCLPDDIKRLVVPVCAHRLLVNNRFSSPSRSASNEASDVLGEILKTVSVPV
jgi:MoxR-like ATPase